MPPYHTSPRINCDIDFNKEQIAGKVAIVTGGASGIGEAYVRALHSSGVKVIIGDKNAESGERLASELTGSKSVQCDATVWEDQVHLFKEATQLSASGEIHYVIANAGMTKKDQTFTFDGKDQEPQKPDLQIIDVNLKGALYTSKLAMHYFVSQNGTQVNEDQEDTCLILISSGAGFLDVPRSPEYSSTKWAVRGIMHALRRTAFYYGSRVNVISPWYIRTGILSKDQFDQVEKSGVEFATAEDAGESQSYMDLIMDDDLCAKCEEKPGDVRCSCGERFCEYCFSKKHLPRNQTHKRGGSKKTETKWNKIKGVVSSFTSSFSPASHFQRDETSKWFGLHISSPPGRKDRIATLVETTRFSSLLEESLHFHKRSPKRQYPSICSFVGDTGAGKSTLIRSLIFDSDRASDFDPLDAPVPGAQTGSSAIRSTTGEVNLYLDPSTFGTVAPMFYADCEGLLGTEPLAAEHQTEWARYGQRYLIESKDGKPVDRRTAVKTIYPRFLYIFSDVICYVTRNHRAWAESALRLLDWSKVGVQNTINQHALPALIIVLNGPTLENEAWLGDDHEVVTDAFFQAIEKEISETTEFRELAQKHGDKTMRQLFARSFSSVYVHYIPLEGFGSLGTSLEIINQTNRLAKRVRRDAERVQVQRAESWTCFDTTQMCQVVHYAFAHLASGSPEPFDFGQCRRQISVPDTTEGHFSEFLGLSLKNKIEERFDDTAAVIATSLLRNSLSANKDDIVLLPSVVLDKDTQAICKRAISQFLDSKSPCAYIDPDSGEKCVNTKSGHIIGHQSASGDLLRDGNFVVGDFNSAKFLLAVESALHATMRAINSSGPSNHCDWRRLAAVHHRQNIDALRQRGGYPAFHAEDRRFPFGDNTDENPLAFAKAFLSIYTGAWHGKTEPNTTFCLGCLFGRPEYRLPCEHVICETCVEDFDDTAVDKRYPGRVMHKRCIICDSSSYDKWPFTTTIRAPLCGLRVLSLDGGGVRGIIELTVLNRLEKEIGLGIPIGSFFDLIVGTSTGGIIALGIGVQRRSATECISLFRDICREGFEAKLLTKSRFFGWAARWFSSSIYKTDVLETALQEAFGDKDPKSLYGLNSSCRVAVTTTAKEDCHLIANYNTGGKDRYLDSKLPLWKAARCTSAAPMYFEHVSHAGHECRDGGLKENNPIQVALNESRKIWEEPTHDVILSLGSGQARYPATEPVSTAIIPKWLSHLFSTLVSTMNGEDAWDKFRRSQDGRIIDRASRFNVRFDGSTEPALDDVNAITSMETAAKKATFYERPSRSLFSATSGIIQEDALHRMADRLRASLYFFDLGSITKHGAVTIIHGWICCRLMPNDQGFKELLSRTLRFIVRGKVYEFKRVPIDQPLRFAVEFQHQHLDEPIRIDVNFGATHSTTISGFPMTLKTLFAHAEPQATSLASVPLAEKDSNSSNYDPPAGANTSQSTSSEKTVTADLSANTKVTTREVPSTQTSTIKQPKPSENNSKTVEDLVSAAKNNDTVKMLELLDQGAPIDGKHGGWTALGCAAHKGQLDAVRALLLHGADMDIRMDVGFGVLPGDGSAINWAACGGYLDIVKILLEKGAKSNICAKRPVFLGTGGTPVTMAAGKGHLEVVRYLLENGCDDDSADGIPGWDAFIIACERGQLSIIKYSVDEKHLPVDRIGSNGATPLITAAQSQQTAIMEYLVKRGAQIDAIDNDGSTALLHAVTKKRVGAVEWLAKHGADVRKQNNKGLSPLKLAKEELRRDRDGKNAAAMIRWLETPINVVFHTKA
ncbi:hypothetical protein FMUND_5550 [Fusarium mundagurra]|uniref:phospholipase A2 n=1 Tax=Fusarium mundagurra TaxID=1567541 RepID=A0A8H5YSJ9_9HYPO|nr:hypothetical protein FMUND_5550 [Fusarium mundagurra]